jgi:hypothetical protein
MKEMKWTSTILAILVGVAFAFGQGMSKLTAQQFPLLAATELSPIKARAMVAGGLAGCDDVQQETASPDVTSQLVCRVPPTPHYVQYRAFIPADHLVTAVPCFIGQAQASPVPLVAGAPAFGLIMIMGDASNFSTHYRIKEWANLMISTTGPGIEAPVVPVPSISYNFEWPSVHGNIASTDFNPTRLLWCWHEQNTGSASLANVGGSTSSTAAYQASVTFCCSAADPLFANPVAPIQYNLKVVVNTQTNMATITGSHTCFPAHEIVIGTQVVYQKNPAVISFVELSRCLIGAQVGLTETQVNCTVKLDGVSKCP